MDQGVKSFRTLGKDVTVEFEEKKSVFLGHASPVSSEAEALAYVKAKKEEYADARHNVYAYLLSGGAVARCSDDGEPQGTAGVPLLDVIKKNGVTDCVIVVTRYFGGILLGAGGLVRAYSTSAKMALDEAGIVTVEEYTDFSLAVSYPEHRKLKNELDKRGIRVLSEEFTDSVLLTLTVRSEEYGSVLAFLSESSAGRLVPEKKGVRFGRE